MKSYKIIIAFVLFFVACKTKKTGNGYAGYIRYFLYLLNASAGDA